MLGLDVRPLFAPGENTSPRQQAVAGLRSVLPGAEAERRHTSGSALAPVPWLPPPMVDRRRLKIADSRSRCCPWKVWHRERREGRQQPTSGRLVAAAVVVAAVAPRRQPRRHT